MLKYLEKKGRGTSAKDAYDSITCRWFGLRRPGSKRKSTGLLSPPVPKTVNSAVSDPSRQRVPAAGRSEPCRINQGALLVRQGVAKRLPQRSAGPVATCSKPCRISQGALLVKQGVAKRLPQRSASPKLQTLPHQSRRTPCKTGCGKKTSTAKRGSESQDGSCNVHQTLPHQSRRTPCKTGCGKKTSTAKRPSSCNVLQTLPHQSRRTPCKTGCGKKTSTAKCGSSCNVLQTLPHQSRRTPCKTGCGKKTSTAR